MKQFLSTFMAAALVFQGQVHANETEVKPVTAEVVMAELEALPGDKVVAEGMTVAELESTLDGLSDEQLAQVMEVTNHALAQQQNLAESSLMGTAPAGVIFIVVLALIARDAVLY